MTDQNILRLIISECCNYYHQPRAEVLSRKRNRELVKVKHFAMYFAKKYTILSLDAIGDQMGGYDHASVLHAIKAINDDIVYNGAAVDAKNIKSRIDKRVYGWAVMFREKRLRYHYRNMFRKSRRNKK